MFYLAFACCVLVTTTLAAKPALIENEWKNAQLSTTLKHPNIKWRWYQKRIEICLPEKTRWVQVRTVINKNKVGLRSSKSSLQKVLAFIRREIKTKLKPKNFDDVFWYSAVGTSNGVTDVSFYFNIPNNDDVKFDLRCRKDLDHQCAHIVYKQPSCYFGSTNQHAATKYTITMKPENLPQGRFPTYRFYEGMEECDCHT